MSVAKTLSQAISAKLATILVANGYATDIGTKVYRGKMVLTADDLPCVVIVESDDRVDGVGVRREIKSAVRYIIEGHSVCDPDNPNDMAHDIVSDLKRCIFSADSQFGGLVRPNDTKYIGRQIGTREDGTAIVAGSIEIELAFHEKLDAP